MMKRLPISFKDKQHEALRKIAHLENTSMADLAREAVDDLIKKKKPHNGNGSKK